MKALVIGGAGFIGSHLCDALVEDGHTVTCVDNLSLGSEDNIRHLLNENNFTFNMLDACDEDALMYIVRESEPDMVYHLAANSDIQKSAKDPIIEFENTYSTTFATLNVMRKQGVKSLFFASTSAVYGDKRGIVLDEKTPELSPVSYYGAAKLGSEALISAFTYMNDMSSLVFRFPNVIGPRLTHGVVYDFIRKLKNNPQELEILGDGRQEKPYIYVADLIDAIKKFSYDVKPGVCLYNIGVDGATSVTRIADFVCEEMGLNNVSYTYTGGEGGWKGDVPRFTYCLDKVHAAGWKATLNSDEAVKRTVKENLIECS